MKYTKPMIRSVFATFGGTCMWGPDGYDCSPCDRGEDGN